LPVSLLELPKIIGKALANREGCMPRKHQGWSLVESMVVLTIVAVMLAWGVPSFLTVIQQTRLSAATHDFTTSMALARSEAIKRNARVVMCVAASESACSPSGPWSQGWLLFQDVNSNGALDDTEQVIAYQQPLHAGLLIKGNMPVSKYISYTGTGRSHMLSGAIQMGTVSICHRASTGIDGRSIVINAVGRPRVSVWKKPGACE
jgi:type IV fimbrial biogenesis protein FimT